MLPRAAYSVTAPDAPSGSSLGTWMRLPELTCCWACSIASEVRWMSASALMKPVWKLTRMLCSGPQRVQERVERRVHDVEESRIRLVGPLELDHVGRFFVERHARHRVAEGLHLLDNALAAVGFGLGDLTVRA